MHPREASLDVGDQIIIRDEADRIVGSATIASTNYVRPDSVMASLALTVPACSETVAHAIQPANFYSNQDRLDEAVRRQRIGLRQRCVCPPAHVLSDGAGSTFEGAFGGRVSALR
jgi:hypothetical protein